jgi:hypothetical protein
MKKSQGLLSIGHRAIAGITLYGVVLHSANAQQPPDVVQSDGNYNTAMGTDALFDLSAGGGVGDDNTASGAFALYGNTSGFYNTALGSNALNKNKTGYYNTASGAYALNQNATGFYNTADGSLALELNVLGTFNTGIGTFALSNNNANDNTAVGYSALTGNVSGIQNTAVGSNALAANGGNDNTALGFSALLDNVTGIRNVAVGAGALYTNTSSYNTATGDGALYSNGGGSENTATGYSALLHNTSGSNNVAVGYQAGINLTTGSNDVDIANAGIAGEGGTIRIGTSGSQSRTFVAGIENSHLTGAAVYVSSSGQLGVLASSERYKSDIQSLGGVTDKLQKLRPVSFHLRSEPDGAVQYGLIAEEVDKVFPELVIRDDQGQIQGVRYDELAPMLLAVVQRQKTALETARQKIDAQARKIAEFGVKVAQVVELKAQVEEIQRSNSRIEAGLAHFHTPDAQVARR